MVARAIWDGNLMSFVTLPNNSIMMVLITEEICMDDCHEEQVGSDGKELHPLQWKRIRLNLPGTKTYDPSLSWISKMQVDGRLA